MASLGTAVVDGLKALKQQIDSVQKLEAGGMNELREHVHYLPGDYADSSENWTNHGVYLGHTAGLGQMWSHGFTFKFAGGVMTSSTTRGWWRRRRGHVMSGSITLTLLKGVAVSGRALRRCTGAAREW
jgi:hypothetical protein